MLIVIYLRVNSLEIKDFHSKRNEYKIFTLSRNLGEGWLCFREKLSLHLSWYTDHHQIFPILSVPTVSYQNIALNLVTKCSF